MQALLKPIRPGPELNVTPMIDVLLVLIIVWLVVLMLARQVLPVQVPAQVRAPGARSREAIVLQLPDVGGYAINGQPIAGDQLETRLHQIYDARPAGPLFIDAGRSRSYQDVIRAMDLARGAGIRVIAILPAH
ncbi:MAG: ExbD/TolR family protein [Gemmatimonadales bacterium]